MSTNQLVHTEDNLLEAFFKTGDLLKFSRNEHILHTQSESDALYYIAKGYIKVYSIDSRGQHYINIIYGPGEMFPLVWLNNAEMKLTRNYQAISECTIRRRSREDFMLNFMVDSQFAYATLQQFISQFSVYNDRVTNLEFTYASERLAYRLVSLADRFGVKKKGRIILNLPLSHLNLANSSNISREVVSRELAKLAQKNIVITEDNKFVILDLDKLYRIFTSNLN